MSNTILIEVVVNGDPRSVPSGRTLADLLRHLEVDASRVAVELNRNIVRRSDWENTPVPAGARLEIVQFVGGG